MFSEIMDFFNSESFWWGIIVFGGIIYTLLSFYTPKQPPKPTTADAVKDLTNEVKFIKEILNKKMK